MNAASMEFLRFQFKPLFKVVFTFIRVFHNKIKLYILRQNLRQTCFNDFSNVKWCMKQTLVLGCQAAQASVA